MRIPNLYFIPQGGTKALCPACAKAAGISRGISTRHYAREPLACSSCGESIGGISPTVAASFQKQATPAQAVALVAKVEALDCTRQLKAMTPYRLAQAVAEHQAQKAEQKPEEARPLTSFGLFGFQPTPATGRQRPLFGDDSPLRAEYVEPTPKPAPTPTSSATWSPRPSTPADKRIARQYKDEGTPGLF